MQIITDIFNYFTGNKIMIVFLLVVLLDVVTGVGRAASQRSINSAIGIDGISRKATMAASLILFGLIDKAVGFNLGAFVPETVMSTLGMVNVGTLELFGIMYILCEAQSILKNLSMVGAPTPNKLQQGIIKLLDNFTGEFEQKEK